MTDHRIGLTLHKIDQFMQGDIDELVGALVEFDRQERLNGAEGGADIRRNDNPRLAVDITISFLAWLPKTR